MLMFTSGTSGRPRAAMLSHRALLANLDQCRALDPTPMTEDDVVLLVLPLFHIYGLNTGLGMVAATGATGVLAERFDPVQTAAVVRAEGVTNIPGAPPMYVAWGAAEVYDDLRGVRMFASGASPLPRVGARAGPHRGRPPGLRGLRAHRDLAGGQQHPRVGPGQGRLDRPAGAGRRGAAGRRGRRPRSLQDDPGEIMVRGANLFSGYWPDGSGGPDADGWWATGDVAYADDDGDLFLVDRRKELVLVSGFNVYPREVEDALAEHADVAEVAVIAVPHPYTGEAVKAFVVPREGSGLRPEHVTAHAATRLARFKRPTIVVIVDELPHSATGKVAKGRLREARGRRTGTHGADPVKPRVTLIGKPGCHLCDEAREVVARVTAELGEDYEELSILDDPELRSRYWEQIPVTLVDGEQHDFWRVSRGPAAGGPDRLTGWAASLTLCSRSQAPNLACATVASGHRQWESRDQP